MLFGRHMSKGVLHLDLVKTVKTLAFNPFRWPRCEALGPPRTLLTILERHFKSAQRCREIVTFRNSLYPERCVRFCLSKTATADRRHGACSGLAQPGSGAHRVEEADNEQARAPRRGTDGVPESPSWWASAQPSGDRPRSVRGSPDLSLDPVFSYGKRWLCGVEPEDLRKRRQPHPSSMGSIDHELVPESGLSSAALQHAACPTLFTLCRCTMARAAACL